VRGWIICAWTAYSRSCATRACSASIPATLDGTTPAATCSTCSPASFYLPVSAKYLQERRLDHYEVLIWSRPHLLVAGRLCSATSDENMQAQAEPASARGIPPDKIDVLLYDQRNHKPRRSRHKLRIESVRELGA
jgi:hypothetical protein